MDAEGKVNPGLFVEPGVLIAGRFEVVDRVGAGGVGMVYRAIDRELDGEVVALKLLLPHLAQDEQVYRRFRNEVLVARSLSHPNIVRTHDMGRAENGFSYISMEFVDGVSLKEKLGDDGSVKPALTFDQALGILYQIISGVAYAHGKGIIHRDLKPANVLISKKGEVKLADFGTARILGMDTSLTQTGQVIGTPDYMSPEQIRGEPLDQACDIYALGIIAYELVVGVKPYIADSAVAIAFKHLNEPIPPFASPQKGVPGWYENVVRTATAKKKDDRFVSVMEFAAVLLDYAPQLSVQSTFFTVDRNTARSSAHYPKVEDSSETPTGERRAVPKNTSNGTERGFELGNALDSGDTGTGWKLGFDSGESAAAAATNEALRAAKKKPPLVITVLAVAGILALGVVAWFVPPLHRASHNIFVMLGLELPTPVGGAQTQVAFDQPTSNTVETRPVVKEPEVVAPVAAVATPEPKITPESKQPEKTEVVPSVVAANQTAPEPTATAVPEPPAPAKLEANLALRSSSGSQNETTFSVDRLGELRWFLTLSGPADGWTAEKIREVYALNVVDTKKAALVSKVPLEKVQMPAKGEPNVRLQGDFAAWKRAHPSVGRYRVDVIQAGEVVASREIELFRASVVASDSGASTAGAGGTVTIVRGASATGEPTEVRPVEPPVSVPPVANTYIPEPTPQPPVATSGGLPVAKGHENSINETRPTNVLPPIQSGSVASSGGTEVIQGSSVGAANVGNQTPPPVAVDEVPAVHEVYGGFMTIARENSMGDERRPIILNLDFRGAQISGSAEIAGYGNLTVSGRVHPRGLDIELSNSETWMRLSSGQRERQLRGRYSIPKEQKKGAFEVSRTGG